MKFRCVVHGSFGRHLTEIRETMFTFKAAGIDVLAPESSEITAINGNFLLLEHEENLDPRFVELRYLHNLQKLGANGFSYFVNPKGYIGKSAAFELGIAIGLNVPVFFSNKPKDLPVYIPEVNIIKPEELIEIIKNNKRLPRPTLRTQNTTLYKMMQRLISPGSVVATGGIIEYRPRDTRLPEVLLVKTHKWGNKYSMVGGKVQRGERLHQALHREVKEETGLNVEVGPHICTFDQIEKSGYYQDYVHHMFVDFVVQATSKKIRLNDEAQDYVWAPAEQALAELDIEPNARHTLELFVAQQLIPA